MVTPVNPRHFSTDPFRGDNIQPPHGHHPTAIAIPALTGRVVMFQPFPTVKTVGYYHSAPGGAKTPEIKPTNHEQTTTPRKFLPDPDLQFTSGGLYSLNLFKTRGLMPSGDPPPSLWWGSQFLSCICTAEVRGNSKNSE
jgi:hypothetical protein